MINEIYVVVRGNVTLCKVALLCIQLEHFYPYTGPQVKCSDVYSELHLAMKDAKIASSTFLSPLFSGSNLGKAGAGTAECCVNH